MTAEESPAREWRAISVGRKVRIQVALVEDVTIPPVEYNASKQKKSLSHRPEIPWLIVKLSWLPKANLAMWLSLEAF